MKKFISIILVFIVANVAFAQTHQAKVDSMLQYYQTVKNPDGTVEYRHNNWGLAWLNENGLYVSVAQDGRLDVIGCYHGEEPIHLSHLGVKIGFDTVKTKPVAANSTAYHIETGADSILTETIRYRGAENLIEKILKAYRTTIKIVLYGQETMEDDSLDISSKQAIRDSYELAKVIKENHRK